MGTADYELGLSGERWHVGKVGSESEGLNVGQVMVARGSWRGF